jgi:hypothetical protein
MIRQEAAASLVASFVLWNLNYLNSVELWHDRQRKKLSEDALTSREELSQTYVGRQLNDLD